MGEALSAGQGINGLVQGYQAGRGMVLQEKAQQASQLHDLSDRLIRDMDHYADDDPMRNVLWQAYSETRDKQDKLTGEKGQGAWKTVKPLLGLVIPHLRDKEQADPSPTASGPGGTQFPLPGAPAGGPPATGGAPTSIYEQMAAHPPQSQDQRQEKAKQAFGSFLDQYKTWDEAKADPEFGHKFVTASMAGAKVGINAGQMLDMKLKPNEPMMQVSAEDPMSQYVGQTRLPLSQYLNLVKAVPDAKERLQNHWSQLQSDYAGGKIQPGSPQYAEFSKLRTLMDPNMTEMDVITKGTPDDIERWKQAVKYKEEMQHMFNPNRRQVTSVQVDDTTGQAYMFTYDQEKNRATSIPVMQDGKPVYLGRGARSAYVVSGVNGSRLNLEAIRRDLENKKLSPQEAASFLPMAGQLYQNRMGQQTPNPNVQYLVSMIRAAEGGQPIPQSPVGYIPIAAPGGQPSSGSGWNPFNWFGGSSEPAKPAQTPGFMPQFSEEQLDRLFPQ